MCWHDAHTEITTCWFHPCLAAGFLPKRIHSSRGCGAPDQAQGRNCCSLEESSWHLIIWLLQQAPIGSVEACPDRHSPKRSASFSPTLPRRKPASDIWQLVGGRMGSRVRDAGIRKPMSC